MINEKLFEKIVRKLKNNDKDNIGISLDIATLYKECSNKTEIGELYSKFENKTNYKKDTIRKKRKTGEFLLDNFSKNFISTLNCQYSKIEAIINKSEKTISTKEKIELIKKLANNETVIIPNNNKENLRVNFNFTEYERKELELLLKQDLENYLKQQCKEIENGLKFKLRLYLQDKACRSVEALTNFLIFVSGVRSVGKCKEM